MRNEEEAIKIVYLTSSMGHTHRAEEYLIMGEAANVIRMTLLIIIQIL